MGVIATLHCNKTADGKTQHADEVDGVPTSFCELHQEQKAVFEAGCQLT
jgi:hypothetical protein